MVQHYFMPHLSQIEYGSTGLGGSVNKQANNKQLMDCLEQIILEQAGINTDLDDDYDNEIGNRGGATETEGREGTVSSTNQPARRWNKVRRLLSRIRGLLQRRRTTANRYLFNQKRLKWSYSGHHLEQADASASPATHFSPYLRLVMQVHEELCIADMLAQRRKRLQKQHSQMSWID